MYFYNISSSKKVLHLSDCRYIKSSDDSNVGYFYSLSCAINKGYRPCHHCFTLIGRFAEEKERINKYCTRYNYNYSYSKDSVEISTGKGQWKIIQEKIGQSIELFHKNTQNRNSDCYSKIPGYHNQKIIENEMVDYIHYICSHDGINKKPPAIGTKKYKKIQKKRAAAKKRNSINNVLCLIDSLNINR
ncbi:MAG: hypothetical protein IJB86_04610 [Clostridia bacterium]|nr:hypothetical protein [Clostridia bacterium]